MAFYSFYLQHKTQKASSNVLFCIVYSQSLCDWGQVCAIKCVLKTDGKSLWQLYL